MVDSIAEKQFTIQGWTFPSEGTVVAVVEDPPGEDPTVLQEDFD